MPNVLLFGYRGHLARTKVLPAIQKFNHLKYVPLSRQHVTDLSEFNDQDNIAYMSIPTHNFFENVEPYQKFIKNNKPTFVIEKPHGRSLHEFQKLDNYFKDNDLKVLYNDHYLFKDDILHFEHEPTTDIHSIDIVINETLDITERLDYFDKVGILKDMYQSHIVCIIAEVLGYNLNMSRTEILEELAQISPYFYGVSKYPGYPGKNYTACKVILVYRGIIITVLCSKNAPAEQKHIVINDNTQISLKNNEKNPYETVFEHIIEGKTQTFLNSYEVELLWNHFNFFH